MKRILIFSLNYYPFVGGAEVAIKEVTDRMPSEDFEFHLIAYRFDSALPKQERIGNVTVHRIGFGKRHMSLTESFNPIVYLAKVAYIPLAALTALRLHKKYRFDGAWAMMVYMVFPLVLMRMVGVRIPYLLTLQEGDPFEHVFERFHIRLVKPFLSYGLTHASAVQAISNFLLEWAQRLGFKGEGKVIPNGVDTKLFAKQYAPEEVGAYREILGKRSGDVFLVTTSRLVHKNAIDDVIRALPLLPEHISFIVYGIGPDEAMLRDLARTLSVEDRVKFMGQIGHAEMPAMLKACDIFIRPSRSEGMGNSFVEAMSAGLPVIATQEGGIADFLFDPARDPGKERTGWAVDHDAPLQIAEAVQRILATPEEVQDVRERAKAMVSERYDWEKVAVAMRGLFERIV